jgi:hypothetical protein
VKLLLALLIALSPAALAQEAKKKPVAKKQKAHTKATPEQIRKFNQLQDKRKK